MACDALGAELSAYHDREVDAEAAARVEAHLATCGECRRALTTWVAAGRAIREDRARLPDAAGRFRAAIRERRGPAIRPASWRRHLPRFAAIAASTAVLATGVLYRESLSGIDELARLAADNREQAIDQKGSIDAFMLDLSAELVRLRGSGADESQIAPIESEMRALSDEARRIKDQIAAVERRVEAAGLAVPGGAP
jgi:hypothetical protein